MKKIYFFVLLGALLWGSSASAAKLSEAQKKECMKLLQIAETKQIDWVYDTCNFDDEEMAWYEWAPLATSANYPKAMYQLCKRHPKHDYAPVYCERAAEAGNIPAIYEVAKKALDRNELNLYQANLKKIIETNDVKNKKLLRSDADFVARQAYEDLGRFYLQQSDAVQKSEGMELMRVAADLGSSVAAHTLAILLYSNPEASQQALSQKYLWKAIGLGCPAAEENLGIMNYLAADRIYADDARQAIERKLFTCDVEARKTGRKVILTAKDCACKEVLSWYASQSQKPFMIASIDEGAAVLKDSIGTEYSVTKGDKVANGYVVEDVRPTAVIIRRINERHVLLYREDTSCVPLCQNPNVIPKEYVNDLPIYELQFTPSECQKLAEGIEDLNNPEQEFKGFAECQLKDWNRWGEGALAKKRNKHLFLLGNYEKSDYIPAQVALAEYLFANKGPEYMPVIGNLLTYATQRPAIDALSAIKREQAYCIKTKLHMDGTYADEDLAFAWAEAGADEGYAQSLNMLGVAYAKGIGTERNLTKAEEAFLAADRASVTPFTDARFNYQILKSNGNLDEMKYGQCRQILEPVQPTAEELLKLYEKE